PSTAPAMPSSIVMMNPPGSRPGINSFAMMPTTSPKRIQPSTPNITPPLARPRSGEPQYLPRLDQIGIAQLILVEIEDLHVVRRAAQLVLGDTAQRIARLHRVRFARACVRRPCASVVRGPARHFDVGDDVLLPGGNSFDGIPNLVFLCFGGDGPREVELAVTFLRGAVKLAISRLDGPLVHSF